MGLNRREMRVGAKSNSKTVKVTQSCHRANLVSKKIKMCPNVTALDPSKGRKTGRGTTGERHWRGVAKGLVDKVRVPSDQHES